VVHFFLDFLEYIDCQWLKILGITYKPKCVGGSWQAETDFHSIIPLRYSLWTHDTEALHIFIGGHSIVLHKKKNATVLNLKFANCVWDFRKGSTTCIPVGRTGCQCCWSWYHVSRGELVPGSRIPKQRRHLASAFAALSLKLQRPVIKETVVLAGDIETQDKPGNMSRRERADQLF